MVSGGNSNCSNYRTINEGCCSMLQLAMFECQKLYQYIMIYLRICDGFWGVGNGLTQHLINADQPPTKARSIFAGFAHVHHNLLMEAETIGGSCGISLVLFDLSCNFWEAGSMGGLEPPRQRFAFPSKSERR